MPVHLKFFLIFFQSSHICFSAPIQLSQSFPGSFNLQMNSAFCPNDSNMYKCYFLYTFFHLYTTFGNHVCTCNLFKFNGDIRIRKKFFRLYTIYNSVIGVLQLLTLRANFEHNVLLTLAQLREYMLYMVCCRC